MSLIPCCDLYADHRPCRCAFEAKPFRATRRFSINNMVPIEDGAIIKIHPNNGAIFIPGRGPWHMPQIKGAVSNGWLVPVEGDAADERWTRPETTDRYDLIDQEWLD